MENSHTCTVCQGFGQAQLGQTCLWWFGFRLYTIFDNVQQPQKMMIASKLVKSDSKIIIMLHQSKSVSHSVGVTRRLTGSPHYSTLSLLSWYLRFGLLLANWKRNISVIKVPSLSSVFDINSPDFSTKFECCNFRVIVFLQITRAACIQSSNI